MKKKVIIKQRKLKSGHGPHRGSDTKTNWPNDRRSQGNLKLNLKLEDSITTFLSIKWCTSSRSRNISVVVFLHIDIDTHRCHSATIMKTMHIL
jgi:hypothetical protein